MGYGTGYLSGEEYIDTVMLSPDLVISQQSIGVAYHPGEFLLSTGVYADGILGLGPVDLTIGTVNGTDTVPTVMDNLFSQGQVSNEMFGIYYLPFSKWSTTGEITFGGYDASVIASQAPVYAPLTTKEEASYYWGIDLSINYGHNSDTILPTTSGFVDSGTTLIYIASGKSYAGDRMVGNGR